MAGFLDRLGQGAARHKWATVGVWLLVAVLLVVAAEASGGTTVDVFKIPGAQSEKARDLLQQRFPAQSGDTADVAFQARNGTITDPANQAAIAETEANLQPRKIADITQVIGPATPIAGSAFVSKDGTIGYVRVQYDQPAPSPSTASSARLEAATQPAKQAGIRVDFGGPVTDYFNRNEGGNADVIGLIFAVIILL